MLTDYCLALVWNFNFYHLYSCTSIEGPHKIFAPRTPFSVNAPLVTEIMVYSRAIKSIGSGVHLMVEWNRNLHHSHCSGGNNFFCHFRGEEILVHERLGDVLGRN